MTGQKIPLAGVLGSPIAHSRSPQLHGHWLKISNTAGYYIPMDVAPDDLETVLRSLPRAGFRGVNVTIPHKEAVLKLADEATETARRIGAANTLTFLPDGRIHADNTDGYGFLANLRAGAPEWTAKNSSAVVLGAGGASRAVIVSLLEAGISEIRLSNRTKSRAESLSDEFGPGVNVYDWDSVPEMISGAGLVVNTTSLGMTGKAPLEADLSNLSPQTIVTDLVYTPLNTGLLVAAAAIGCRTVDGLGMLLHQGVPGFERWFGTKPVVDDALREAVLS